MSQAPTMSREKRNDLAVKIDAGIVRKAKLVASGRDMTLAKYLSELLEPIVARDHAAFIRDEARNIDKPHRPPK